MLRMHVVEWQIVVHDMLKGSMRKGTCTARVIQPLPLAACKPSRDGQLAVPHGKTGAIMLLMEMGDSV